MKNMCIYINEYYKHIQKHIAKLVARLSLPQLHLWDPLEGFTNESWLPKPNVQFSNDCQSYEALSKKKTGGGNEHLPSSGYQQTSLMAIIVKQEIASTSLNGVNGMASYIPPPN